MLNLKWLKQSNCLILKNGYLNLPFQHQAKDTNQWSLLRRVHYKIYIKMVEKETFAILFLLKYFFVL